MAYGSRDFTGGMSQALSDTYNRLVSVGDEEFKRDRLAAQDERQARLDAQNKQLFDLRIRDAEIAEKNRLDEIAYLKGINNPNSYGLKAGTDQVVDRLGQYAGGTRSEAITKPYEQYFIDMEKFSKGEIDKAPVEPILTPSEKVAYEQYFKEMEQLGDNITGQSIDDRTIGFATANPDNIYASREALKAGISRKDALDAEAKEIAANKLKYQLEGLKQLGKVGGSTVTDKTAGGYKVKDPGSVLKDAFGLVKTQYGKATGDKIDPRVAKQATLMANAGYDSAQIAKAVNTSYTPSKTETFLGIDWLNPDSASKFDTSTVKLGPPRNVSTSKASGSNTVYRDNINALAKSLDQRLEDVDTQRKGEFGLNELQKIIGGGSNTSKKQRIKAIDQIVKSDPAVTKENESVIKKAVEAVVNKTIPTQKDVEAIEKAAIVKADKELQKRAQALKASMKTAGLGPMSEKNKAQWKFLINSFTRPVKSAYELYQENIGRPFSRLVNEYAPGGSR